MKLLTAFAITALSLSFGANAFAQSSTSGMTRAEVRAQLVQAEADGLVPAPKNDYPPSAEAVAHNREIYAIRHGTDGASLTKTAGSAGVRSESASN
ncbi:DUF4148 domain-containing protein [Paraburkholderia sediminicola]|jgi:hypothetical protein|uniref:DUF4148 domain-containing protein n=1 Tax=Paraburkholderia sediminicola TaxID=458836 RepID=UPI0038BBCD8E